MIKVKLIEIVNAKTAIERLIQEKLPSRISYANSRLLRMIEPELVQLDKHRRELAEKFNIDENTPVDPAVQSEFLEELLSLLSSEVELGLDKIDMTAVLDTLQISTSDLILLEPLFNFEPI